MKRTISILLVLTMILSLFVINVSAATIWNLPEEASGSHGIRFGLLVDSHITSSGNGSTELNNAAGAFANLDIDAMVFSGDIVMHSATELTETAMTSAYGHLKTVLANNGISTVANTAEVENGKTPLIYATGNHEFPMGKTGTAESAEALNAFENQMACEQNSHNVVNGYHFITSGGYNYNSFLSTDNMNYVIDEIAVAEAADSSRPIFVVLHHPIYETVAGSDFDNCGEDRYANSNKSGKSFKEYLNEHPRVIVLSGHTHERIQNPQSVWQDGFTSVGSGYVGGGGSGNYSQGYFVEAEGTIVKFYKMNYLTGEYMGKPWTIDVSGTDKFAFTAAKKAEAKAPAFPANTNITYEEVLSDAVTFSWNDATMTSTAPFQDDYIDSYYVELTNASTKATAFSGWCQNEYYLANDTTTNLITAEGLEGNTTYNVEITAKSPLGKLSAPITSSFKTADEALNPSMHSTFEGEDNDAKSYYLGALLSDYIVEDSDARGGKANWWQGGGVNRQWSYTPEKTGYYTFDVVGDGDKNKTVQFKYAKSADTLSFTNVATTDVISTGSWGLSNPQTTRVGTVFLEKDVKYILDLKFSGTYRLDYFNVYLEEAIEAESDTNATVVSDASASGGKVTSISSGGSITVAATTEGKSLYKVSAYGSGDSAAKGTFSLTASGITATADAVSLESGNAVYFFADAGEAKITLSVSGGNYNCDYITIQQLQELTITGEVIEAENYDSAQSGEGTSVFPAAYGDYVNGVFSSGVYGSNLNLGGYSFNVASDSEYLFEVIGAADTASKVTITIDGDSTKTVTGTVAASVAADSIKTQVNALGTISLTAGTHTLAISTDENPVAINAVRLKKSQFATSFVFNAETDYDRSVGQGVGWFDNSPTSIDSNSWFQESEKAIERYGYIEVWANGTEWGGGNNGWEYDGCNGKGIVYMTNNEWLRYTINADYSGYYKVSLAIKAASSKTESVNLSVIPNGNENQKITKAIYQANVQGSTPPEHDMGYVWLDEGENTIIVKHDQGTGSTQLDAVKVTCPDMALYQLGTSGILESHEASDYKTADSSITGTYAWVVNKDDASSYPNYVEWTFDAPVDGKYTFSIKGAGGSGLKGRLKVDGTTVLDNISMNTDGSHYGTQMVTELGEVALTKGEHTIRYTNATNSIQYRFDYIRYTVEPMAVFNEANVTESNWNNDFGIALAGTSTYAEWTFVAPADGEYHFTVKGAGNVNSNSLNLLVDGTTVLSKVTVTTDSSDWGKYIVSDLGTVPLTKGTHTLRLTTNTGSYFFFKNGYLACTIPSERVQIFAPGNYLAKANITDWVTDGIEPVLYAAVYDENDVLVSAQMASEQDSAQILTTDSITVADGQYVKLFMWNGGDMKPLMGSLLYEE